MEGGRHPKVLGSRRS